MLTDFLSSNPNITFTIMFPKVAKGLGDTVANTFSLDKCLSCLQALWEHFHLKEEQRHFSNYGALSKSKWNKLMPRNMNSSRWPHFFQALTAHIITCPWLLVDYCSSFQNTFLIFFMCLLELFHLLIFMHIMVLMVWHLIIEVMVVATTPIHLVIIVGIPIIPCIVVGKCSYVLHKLNCHIY